MEFTQLVWDVFAVFGIATMLYVVYRQAIKMFMHGDDAPIRVKGGSVFVEHTKFDWELDEDEDDREYHEKGKQNGWKVDIWKNETEMENGTTPVTFLGRRVIVHVDDGSGGPTDYRIEFRSNGSARVVDQDRKLTHVAKLLQNTTASHRITRVVVKTKGSPDQVHAFAAGEKGFIKLWPQP